MSHFAREFPRLIAFSDVGAFPRCDEALLELMGEADPGTVAIVLRDRSTPIRARVRRGEKLAGAARASGQMFLVSDRADLAQILEADGVHLPVGGIPPERLRSHVWYRRKWISRAGHGWSELSRSALEALDAVVISPVYAKRKERRALGTNGLVNEIGRLRQRLVAAAPYALGGVGPETAVIALSSGAQGVAAIGTLMNRGTRVELLQSLDILR